LTGIYFGLNTKDEDKKLIHKLVKGITEKEIKYSEMKISKGEYKLESRDYDLTSGDKFKHSKFKP
jgi:hypothetical protein